MARYDKYDPKSGGFRAPLAVAVTAPAANGGAGPVFVDVLYGVSLDAQGRVVVGTAGPSGLVGVMAVPSPKRIGDIVDVMTAGEVVEFALANGDAAAPGTRYGVAASGAVATGTGSTAVGFTVEEDRLIVRVDQNAEAAA